MNEETDLEDRKEKEASRKKETRTNRHNTIIVPMAMENVGGCRTFLEGECKNQSHFSWQGGYADVLLELENGESVPVHRSLLIARSSHFRSLLAGAETVSKKVPGAPALVKEVIRFFYCGLPPENLESLAMDLLPVARQFYAYELRNMCDYALRRTLTVENLVDVLVLSEENCCPGLFAFCLPLYRASASRLKAECQEKLKANPRLLLKLALKGCAEWRL